MSDATEPRQTTPFPKDGAPMLPPHVAADPLAGDWSEGLRGPVRALGIVEPRLLKLEGSIPPPPLAQPAHSEPPPVAPVAEVETPDAWGAAAADPLRSPPPPQSEPPSVIITFTDPPASAPPPSAMPDATPPSPAPAFQAEVAPAAEFLPDVTPASPAPAFQPEITPASAAPAFLPDVTPSSPAPAFLPDVTPSSPAPAFLPDVTPSSPAPAFLLDVTPASPAPAFLPEVAPAAAAAPATDSSAHASDSQAWANAIAAAPGTPSAPTPWSEPIAPPPPVPAADPWKDAPLPMPGAQAEASPSWDQVTAVGTPAPALVPPPSESWDMHPPQAPAAAEDAWSAPPPSAAPATEWKAEAPAQDWQEIKRPQPEMAAPPPADWGTLSSGPDWSSAPPPQADASDEAWGSAPPPPAESAWDAAPAPAAAAAWEAPAAPEETEWTAPAPAPAAASAWSAAPVGASALEQMDSDPPDIEPVPGAAKELFGSVPVGSSLSSDEDAPGGDLGPPEELASPEEVLRPVQLSDDDADLLVPVEEDAPPPRPPAQPLAAMQPVAQVGPLEMRGEHRVAVHTRGGRTRRGTVNDIDLAKSQFSLVPQGGGAAEPVYHAEVKAIFFMLAPGEKLKEPDGRKVRVTFADGRSIEGRRDGGEAKHGFFLVPSDAARTNTRRIYVAREATTDVKDG